MTRIFTDGAEFGDVLFWDISTGSVDSGIKRTGNYSYRHQNVVATKYFSGISELYLRWCFYHTSALGRTIMEFRNSTTSLCQISLTAGGLLSANVNGSSVATSTSSFPNTTWRLIEVHLLINDSGTFQVKIDGVLEIDYSGDTKPGAATTVDNIYISPGNYSVFTDDYALNDTNGSVDNSWCGDGHIELLTPNANGDTNNWTGSDGDSVNNYLLVDDFPHDTDTTYVKDSANNQDMYNLTDFTDTGKIVTRIYSECRAKDNDATAGVIKIGYKTGGTVYLSSAYRTLSGNYARVVGDEAAVDPNDSLAWSNADLDAIQFVVECSSSSSSSSTTTSSSSTVIP